MDIFTVPAIMIVLSVFGWRILDLRQRVTDLEMYSFNERHINDLVGYISNQSGSALDSDRPYASAVVCSRPECQLKAQRWVAATTNEPARLFPFKEGDV